jgi:hypothetical protein
MLNRTHISPTIYGAGRVYGAGPVAQLARGSATAAERHGNSAITLDGLAAGHRRIYI